MRKRGEKNCRAQVYLAKELGILVVVSSGAEPGESSYQGFASPSTGDREDILDPVELKFLNDNLPAILEDMRTSETQFSIPSSKGPGLSVCLEKGKHEDLQDKECRLMDAIVRKEIVSLLEQLENAKTSQDSEAVQAYNRAIPHLLNNLSTIPLDLIDMVYKIEPKGSYLRRITLGIFLGKGDPRVAIPEVQRSGILDFKRDFNEQVFGFGEEGAVGRQMGLFAHPL